MDYLDMDGNINGRASGQYLWAVEAGKCSFLHDARLLEEKGRGVESVRDSVTHTLAIGQSRNTCKLTIAEEVRLAPGFLGFCNAVVGGARESGSHNTVGELLEITAMPEIKAGCRFGRHY